MKIDRLRNLLIAAGCFALLSLLPSSAHARGIAVINTGSDVMSIAPVSAEGRAGLGELPGGEEPQVGIMYSRFGLFWLDIVRWNAEYCMFVETSDGFSYDAASPEELAELAGVDVSEITIPTRYYLPPGGVILGIVVVLGAAIFVVASISNGKRRRALLADARYANAVQQFQAMPEQPAEDCLSQLVEALAGEGIAKEEATENLRFLLGLEAEDDAEDAA